MPVSDVDAEGLEVLVSVALVLPESDEEDEADVDVAVDVAVPVSEAEPLDVEVPVSDVDDVSLVELPVDVAEVETEAVGVPVADAVGVPDTDADAEDVALDEGGGGGAGGAGAGSLGGGELPDVGGPCVVAVADGRMVTLACDSSLPSLTLRTTRKEPLALKVCSMATGSVDPERGAEPSPRSRAHVIASPSASRAPRENTTPSGVRPLDGVACSEADGGSLPGTRSGALASSLACVPGSGSVHPAKATAASSRARVAGMRMMTWPSPPPAR